jgi:hypothetical protein
MKLHDAIRKSDSNGKDNSAIRYVAISWAATAADLFDSIGQTEKGS